MVVVRMDSDDSSEHITNFLVVEDPGPYPLMFEMELSTSDVFFGLLHGGFYPGTVLLDQRDGRRYTVRSDRQRLKLEPRCERMRQYAHNHRYTYREEFVDDLDQDNDPAQSYD